MALTIIAPKNAVVDRTANTTFRWITDLSSSHIIKYEFQYKLKSAGSWTTSGEIDVPSGGMTKLSLKLDDFGFVDGYEYNYRFVFYYKQLDGSNNVIYEAREVSLPCSIVVHGKRIGRLRIKVDYGDVETIPLYENTNNTAIKNRIKISDDLGIGSENVAGNAPQLGSRLKTRNNSDTKIAIGDVIKYDFYYNTSINGSVYRKERYSTQYYSPKTYDYRYDYNPSGTYYSYQTNNSYNYITGYHISGTYTWYSADTGTGSYDVFHDYTYGVYHTYHIPYEYSPGPGQYASAYYTKYEYAYLGYTSWYTTYYYNYTYYTEHTQTNYAADYASQWIYDYKQNYYSYKYSYTSAYAYYAYNYAYSYYKYSYYG